MSSSTAKYVIPYPVAGDTVAGLATTLQNMANRMDLLLGESGQHSIAATANTPYSSVITLARTYPGNATGGSPPGVVILTPFSSYGSGVTWNFWITAWTGTATTVTGFTLNGISSTTTTRTVAWRFIPVL